MGVKSLQNEQLRFPQKPLSHDDLLTALSGKSIGLSPLALEGSNGRKDASHTLSTLSLRPPSPNYYSTTGQMAVFFPFVESIKIAFMPLRQRLMLFSGWQYRKSYNEAGLENRAPLMTIVCCAWLICQEACTLPFTKPLLLHNGNGHHGFCSGWQAVWYQTPWRLTSCHPFLASVSYGKTLLLLLISSPLIQLHTQSHSLGQEKITTLEMDVINYFFSFRFLLRVFCIIRVNSCSLLSASLVPFSRRTWEKALCCPHCHTCSALTRAMPEPLSRRC